MTDPRHDDTLPRDPRFDQAWAAVSHEAPPPELDAAILAAAGRAGGRIGIGPGASGPGTGDVVVVPGGESGFGAGAVRLVAAVSGGMSETTAGAPPPNTPSGPTICSTPNAIAPIVAAAASGNHQRSGRVASATAVLASRGPAPTSRRAAARIAASSAGGGASLDTEAHAWSKRGSRGSVSSWRGSVMESPG